jgi:glycosyltransferase involved in cell wall biosynthesis
MSREIVSVIIPVFNRGHRLKEAVMSVLLQSYSYIEIIIIDDGSTDDTKLIAEKLAIKWPNTVKVFSINNSGPGPARELGTIKSKGEFIQYLDSDDLLLPSKLELQVRALRQNPECGISYGVSYQADYFFKPPLITGPIRSTGEEVSYLFPKLLNDRWWTTSCPLYRSSIVKMIGPWKPLLNEEDWEFDARAGRIHTLLLWVPAEVSIRRINLSKDHLSYGGCSNIRKLADRVFAKQLLFEYAIDNGIENSQDEMKVFARECFLLSRQCSVAGLEKEACLMFRLSRDASDRYRKNGIDYLIYRLLASLIGWCRTGNLTSKIRNML